MTIGPFLRMRNRLAIMRAALSAGCEEPVGESPFYCGEPSAAICGVLGSKNSSTYFREYASGFSEPAA